MSSPSGSFDAALAAMKEGHYQNAIMMFEMIRRGAPPDSQTDLQAQMYLVQAYQKSGQTDQAIALCRQLANHANDKVKAWATQALPRLEQETSEMAPEANSPSNAHSSEPMSHKAGRATMAGVKVAMAGVAGNLALASGVTIVLLFGMVLVLCFGTLLILEAENPTVGLGLAIGLTLIINTAIFFLSPWLMDITQNWLYGTRWISIADLERHSPESAKVIRQVCADKKLKQPKLGLIDDQNPTAFTYGSLPNTARLVVSKGLFTYLDDDEAATVYAHELGHIVHWDFAVMTLASTLLQIIYLLYVFARRMSRGGGNNKAKDMAQSIALVAYVFYVVGTYILLYLSRTREYFADHFSAETTGNPNGLSRALVKIAYGIVEEGQKAKEPSRLVEGTRALGIYDAKAASSTGTAYRISSTPDKIGRVFLWDMFNPWGWWMELNSTHPLTGKRVRALSTYAEQLGLDTEFDMGRIIGEGRTLNKSKLYGNFALDLVLYLAETIGIFVGLAIATVLSISLNPMIFPACALIGYGIGTLVKVNIMYPNFRSAQETDVLSLMADPYASPLRGQPARLHGELIGRGDAGYTFGSDLKLQDKSGMLFLRYASRFGPIGNFLFGMNRVKNLLGSNGNTIGWFRRGIAPWMDLVEFESDSGTKVTSHHRFWALVLSGGAIALGFFLSILSFGTM